MIKYRLAASLLFKIKLLSPFDRLAQSLKVNSHFSHLAICCEISFKKLLLQLRHHSTLPPVFTFVSTNGLEEILKLSFPELVYQMDSNDFSMFHNICNFLVPEVTVLRLIAQ